MGLAFLITLLAAWLFVYLYQSGYLRSGCSWSRADAPNDDGTWKWRCETCGNIVETSGAEPPKCNNAKK